MHSGWQCVGTRASWKPTTHHDIHYGNVFLHLGDKDSPFPQFSLGDWGLSFHVKDHNTTRKGRWQILQNRELRFFLKTLLTLNNVFNYHPQALKKYEKGHQIESHETLGVDWCGRPPYAKAAIGTVKPKVKEASRVTKKPKSSAAKPTQQNRKPKENAKEESIKLRRPTRLTFLKLFTSISPNTAAIHDNVTSNVISPMSLPTQRIVVEEDDFIIEVTCYNGDSSTTMFCSQAQFLQSAADPESFMNEPARWARPQVISYRLGAFVGQLKWFCERHGRSCSVHLWEAVREGLREKSERLRSQRSANAVLN
ncbi:hypothetical protein BDZ45DRAFT_749591 [Acephala macrosclerotiorum]|nr:hypothetical protein BDZ45DRAFT_749591 [Acephala macrosclerotiorum]